MLFFVARAVSAWWGGEQPGDAGAASPIDAVPAASADRCFSRTEVLEAVEHEVAARDAEIADLRLACSCQCTPEGRGVGEGGGAAGAKGVTTAQEADQETVAGECAQRLVGAQKAELDLLRNILNEMQVEREEMARALASRAGEVDELKQRLHSLDGAGAGPAETTTPVSNTTSEAAGGRVGGAAESGLSTEIWQITGGDKDNEGQTMWVYGTVAEGEGDLVEGGRHIVIELGSNNGQWIASFLEEKRASGIGVSPRPRYFQHTT